jgi:hypothetical protein
MLIFNWNGIGMFAVGFGVAIAIGYLVGISSEGFLMVIAGPVIAVLDLVYRFKSEKGHWLYPEKGGSLFFVPAWCLGVIWFILGIFYMTK